MVSQLVMTSWFVGTHGGVDHSPIRAADIPLDTFEHIDGLCSHGEFSTATDHHHLHLPDITSDSLFQADNTRSPSFEFESALFNTDFAYFDQVFSSFDKPTISEIEMARSQESVESGDSHHDTDQHASTAVQDRSDQHRQHNNAQSVADNRVGGSSAHTSRDPGVPNAPGNIGSDLSMTTPMMQAPYTQPRQDFPRTPRFTQTGFGPSQFPSLVAPLNQPMTTAAQSQPPVQNLHLPASLRQPAQLPHIQQSQPSITPTPSFAPVRAAQRSTRTRNTWLHRSDRWPNLPDSYRVFDQNQPQHQPRTVGTGSGSGRNLMATFGNDQTLRTRVALIVERARPATKFGAGKHKSGNAVIPVGTSLQEIAANYPLHVWGDGLRLFMAEGWSEEQIWNALPGNARLQDAASRPWNYIQAATGREADRIVVEEGRAPRKAQRRKPRKTSAAHDGGADGSRQGNIDPGSNQASTTKSKRLSDGGQHANILGGTALRLSPTVSQQPILQPLAAFPPNPFRTLSGIPQQHIVPAPAHPAPVHPAQQIPVSQIPTQQIPAAISHQPSSNRLRQLSSEIEAERILLNTAHLEYLRQINPALANMTEQARRTYAAGFGVRYLRTWHEDLIQRYIPETFRIMLPTGGNVRYRELEIFRQIQRRSHLVPADQAMQYAEDVRAMSDLHQRMRHLRVARQQLVTRIQRDRNEFASHMQQSGAPP